MHTARQNHETFGGNFFQNFLRRISKSFLIKLMSLWDFIMGKRLRLCHYYAVTQIQSTGKHQGLEQPVIMSKLQGVSQKLTDNELLFFHSERLINTW